MDLMNGSSYGTPIPGPRQGLPGSPTSKKFSTPPATPLKSSSQIGTRLFAIARIGQARQSLADMLVSYSRLLQSNDDTNSRNQLRTEVAELLIDKDPDLLACVLEIAGKQRKTPAPRVLELFDGLVVIATRYESAGIPRDDPAWASLQEMVERLLATYQNRVEEVIPQLKLEGIAATLVPKWLTVTHAALNSVTAVDKLPGLLAQSPAFLLSEAGFSQAVDALDELVVAHMHAEAETLTAHLCTALKAYSKEHRIKAVAGLSLLIENSMDQSATIVIQLEDALMEGCMRETSEPVLRPYLTYLLERMVALFNRDYYERAIRHADTVGLLERSFRKAMGDDAANPVRELGGELSKTAWAQSLAEQLLDGGEKEQAAARILASIDRNLANTLLACIGREDNLGRAQHYARHLKQLCPGSARTFVALMASQNDPALLSKMLLVAPHIGSDDEILDVIFPLLVHQNFDLRATALQFILDRDNERTSAFVSARLRDPRNAGHRELWMSILTKLRHPSAAQVLISELQTEIDSPMPDDRRTLALIEACSVHEDARIGTVLSRLLRGAVGVNETRRLTAIQRESNKAVKLSAMKVLMHFAKDPRVYETFDRLRRDGDQDIARMAIYCLTPAQEGPPRATPSVFKTNSSAVSGRNAALPPTPAAGSGGTSDQFSKPRKGFEELQSGNEVDTIFQPGATISGKHSKLPQQAQTPIPGQARQTPVEPSQQVQFSGKQNALDPSQLPDDIFAGIKPLLEGALQDLGLGMTARITGAKNGVMTIKSAHGNGVIYIQNKVVIAAFFSGKSDIQALAEIGKLKEATFAYYAKSFSCSATMSVDVSTIETAVREYLDG